MKPTVSASPKPGRMRRALALTGASLRQPANAACLLLALATGLSYALGEHAPDRPLGPLALLLIFALAGLKGWLVVDVFMGLRTAPRFWRWLLRAWLLLVCGLLFGIACL